MLIALLAVLKAGCAYVPLDPAHPATRLKHILSEAEVVALISDGSELESLVSASTPLIDLKKEQAAIASATRVRPRSLPRPIASLTSCIPPARRASPRGWKCPTVPWSIS